MLWAAQRSLAGWRCRRITTFASCCPSCCPSSCRCSLSCLRTAQCFFLVETKKKGDTVLAAPGSVCTTEQAERSRDDVHESTGEAFRKLALTRQQWRRVA